MHNLQQRVAQFRSVVEEWFPTPDLRDSADFTITEAAELLDVVIRYCTGERYLRTNDRPSDRERFLDEIGGLLLMVMTTATAAGVSASEALDYTLRKTADKVQAAGGPRLDTCRSCWGYFIAKSGYSPWPDMCPDCRGLCLVTEDSRSRRIERLTEMVEALGGKVCTPETCALEDTSDSECSQGEPEAVITSAICTLHYGPAVGLVVPEPLSTAQMFDTYAVTCKVNELLRALREAQGALPEIDDAQP